MTSADQTYRFYGGSVKTPAGEPSRNKGNVRIFEARGRFPVGHWHDTVSGTFSDRNARKSATIQPFRQKNEPRNKRLAGIQLFFNVNRAAGLIRAQLIAALPSVAEPAGRK
ncbi:hypothetical protein GWI33_001248 [Rhynchophorus ferrugineus]|uniref:Uncharacterized protein n=1 Tax=Rhynchophorus ferrugineus TaxID=354439 RepID=A0A834IZ92_RHYFE|nr:hypothetical protein GWI33_001248 [Rhynchophorus ferrugineus]